MSADKATAPAPDAGESADVNLSAETTDGQAEDAPQDANALQVELKRAREAEIEATRSYQQIRSKFNQRDDEVRTLRAEVARLRAGQGEDDAERAVDDSLANEVVATREEVAWMKFRADHPDYASLWKEMESLAASPVHRRTIETYRVVNGQPILDTFATLHNAYNEAKLQRIEKAQRSTAGQRAAAAATSKTIKAQATISGSGAASEESSGGDYGIPIDELMGMEYEQIIKDPRFKRHIDPNDPPRGI